VTKRRGTTFKTFIGGILYFENLDCPNYPVKAAEGTCLPYNLSKVTKNPLDILSYGGKNFSKPFLGDNILNCSYPAYLIVH